MRRYPYKKGLSVAHPLAPRFSDTVAHALDPLWRRRKNPTLCGSFKSPCVYGDIQRWMIELPEGNTDGTIDERRVQVLYGSPFSSLYGSLFSSLSDTLCGSQFNSHALTATL